jgi:hypothetical protein
MLVGNQLDGVLIEPKKKGPTLKYGGRGFLEENRPSQTSRNLIEELASHA